MNAIIDHQQEWMRSEEEFFAPSSYGAIDLLLDKYQKDRARILEISDQIGEDDCIKHFIEGNSDRDRRWSAPSIRKLFSADGAIAHLNSDYWAQALALTDVVNCMPQDRKNEWFAQIHEQKCPDFEESTVKATIETLLSSRSKFFAERVDGIFRSLSGEHVTNSPMGFRKRMIISGIFSFYVETSRSGYIDDLRIVIAKFMGRGEPDFGSTNDAIKIARRRHGEWIKLDGGALKLRVYLKGTAHLEVHPDMAWRLNCVLAHLYPNAIPSEFRKKPVKKAKDIELIQKPLPFAVLRTLHDYAKHLKGKVIDHPIGISKTDKRFVNAQTLLVLESIGGVRQENGSYRFDYDPRDVIDDIVTNGCVPDHVSHQYYPSPENIAAGAIEMAEIGPNDLCLEPSAGQGGLADFMPKERTHCIEISSLHCKILEAKGHSVTEGDFLNMPAKPVYNRIVMNPPFSDGRWQAHITHAFHNFLSAGGKLVAIIPASHAGKELIPGEVHEYSKVYDNEFEGTSISVVIVKVEK